MKTTFVNTQTVSVIVVAASVWHCDAMAGMGCSNSLVGKVM